MTRSVYLVAGETSGDQHAAALVEALRGQHPDWSFRGLGGERMERAGVDLRENLVDRSVMGVRRVLLEMGFLVDVAARYLQELEADPPDVVILVDYPGLNLNLARMAKRLGVPVIYYICPQVWAWAPWRVRRVAARADQLLVILPFEEPLYRAVHPKVTYVPNPVFEHLTAVEENDPILEAGEHTLAIFPGSRRQEVEESLPLMLAVEERLRAQFPELQVVVSCARDRLADKISSCVGDRGAVHHGDPHALQRAARLSLVVSGTATLEHAFFGTPQVVVYPVKRWERACFGWLSVTPHISLANLYAGKRLVPEFLATSCDVPEVATAAAELWAGPAREQLLVDLAALRRDRFLPGGTAAAAVAVSQYLAELPL
ncbi:MAG: lipid-A-disaccharide synthase [Planctomycetota bacterium]